jgi:hypothetical protein
MPIPQTTASEDISAFFQEVSTERDQQQSLLVKVRTEGAH